LVAIIEGLPAGLKIDRMAVNNDPRAPPARLLLRQPNAD